MPVWSVTVKPNARQERVEVEGVSSLKVWVNAPPVDGKANDAVVRVLAKHFGVPKSKVRIRRGQKGKRKQVEVDGS